MGLVYLVQSSKILRWISPLNIWRCLHHKPDSRLVKESGLITMSKKSPALEMSLPPLVAGDLPGTYGYL